MAAASRPRKPGRATFVVASFDLDRVARGTLLAEALGRRTARAKGPARIDGPFAPIPITTMLELAENAAGDRLEIAIERDRWMTTVSITAALTGRGRRAWLES